MIRVQRNSDSKQGWAGQVFASNILELYLLVVIGAGGSSGAWLIIFDDATSTSESPATIWSTYTPI